MLFKNQLILPSIIYQSRRFFLYSSKKGFNIDILAKIQQPLDFSIKGFLRWRDKRIKDSLLKKYNYNEALAQQFGAEVGVAHFILNLGGRIKIINADEWLSDKKSFPLMNFNDFVIEAIDVSNNNHFMYDNFHNINIAKLKFLDISGCENIDDWVINGLINFRNSLQYLDVSRCPNVSERGLATLHRLKNLKRLRLNNLPNVTNMNLLQIMLEEQLPDCFIEVNADSLAENQNKNLKLDNKHQDAAETFSISQQIGKKIVKTMGIQIVDKNVDNKKEKSTDCDSALIPLLCVHG